MICHRVILRESTDEQRLEGLLNEAVKEFENTYKVLSVSAPALTIIHPLQTQHVPACAHHIIGCVTVSYEDDA